MVDDIIKSEREWQQKTDVGEVVTLILPYGGNIGDNIISRMKKNVTNVIAAMPTGNKSKIRRN